MSRARIVLAAALAAVGLSGCITLLPKSIPADLYRFGVESTPAGPVAPKAGEILKGAISFNQAAAGDRILTVTGQQTAYIAAARWISPASVLFDEALDRAFAANPAAPRLSELGKGARATAILRLDVDSFETRYDQGPVAAPTVVVRIQASLVSARDRSVLGEHTFEARKPAPENRLPSIVQAYDAATTQALGELTAWTSQTATTAG